MLEDIFEFPIYAFSHILNLKILYITNFMYSFQIFFSTVEHLFSNEERIPINNINI